MLARSPQAEVKPVRAYKVSDSTSELQTSFGASPVRNKAQERAEEVISTSLTYLVQHPASNSVHC